MIFTPPRLLMAVPNPRYIDFHAQTTDSVSVHTMTGVSVGPAHANRRIYVCAFWKSAASRTLTSLTINGNPATIDVQHTSPTGFAGCAITSRAVVNGDTADIVTTISGNSVRMAAAVFVSYGHAAGASDTASASESASNDVSVDVTLGGLVIAAAYNGLTTATWTGITQSFDSVIETSVRGSGGFYHAGNAETPRTITMAPASGTDCSAVAASFARL